jgi:transposase-like protein
MFLKRSLVSRSHPRPVGIEVQPAVVLAVLAADLTMDEAARRHGVSAATEGSWRDRFIGRTCGR